MHPSSRPSSRALGAIAQSRDLAHAVSFVVVPDSLGPLACVPGLGFRDYGYCQLARLTQKPITPASARVGCASGKIASASRAMALVPAIREVKAALEAEPECRLAAMSGSGPSCFGIFADHAQARDAAARIASLHPDWWVKPALLQGRAAA